MRREIITWSLVAAMIIGGFAVAVTIVNATLYSAGGFVGSYLDSLARHDAEAALELAGSNTPEEGSRELLVPSAMGTLTDIRQLTDTETEDGTHTVVYSYTAGGQTGQSSFTVERKGTLLGFFPTWQFTDAPLSTIYMTVLHANDFTGNGVALTTPTQNDPAPYLVFTPGLYEFAHDSTFLHADPIDVVSSKPGESVPAALSVEANDAFIAKAQQEVDAYLDQCATQEVLLPTGCPFGQSIFNRIVSTPVWSIADYPAVTLEGSDTPNQWLMPATEGAAHLVVDVRSLFDGSVSTFDEDVPFTVSFVVTFLSPTELLVTPSY